jgi:hypothetical protein
MEHRAGRVAAPSAACDDVKAAYEFLVGNSFVTPIGLGIAVLVALVLLRVSSTCAGIALIVVLLGTLAISVFEKVN